MNVTESDTSLYMSFSGVQVTAERLENQTVRLVITEDSRNLIMLYTPDKQGRDTLWDDTYALEKYGQLMFSDNGETSLINFTNVTSKMLVDKLRELGASTPLF